MAVNRTPVLKRCRSLEMDPVYLGIDKKSRRKAKNAGRKVSEYGMQEVTKYLNYGLMKIHESCTETLKEFQQYAWDDKKPNEDAVIKENDHHCDLIRYYVYTVARQLNRWIV